MLTVEEKRANYAEWARKHKESEYRREREYAAYLERFLSNEDKQDRLPLPYNLYFS